MWLSPWKAGISILERIVLVVGFLLVGAANLAAEQPESAQPFTFEPAGAGAGAQGSMGGPPAAACEPAIMGSPFIPVDSWVYPAMMRLYGMGYVDHVFLGLRPWTRQSINRMLEDTAARIADADASPLNDQAEQLYEALAHELRNEMAGPCLALKGNTRLESVYSLSRVMTGTPLRDSFHMGSTVVNDYGRPYANGFNNYTGASAYAIAGRFTLYARGEFQYAPSSQGYSPLTAQGLSSVDAIPFLDPVTGLPYSQPTIPAGNMSSTTTMRWLELYASYHVLNHEISFGKQDEWMGPGLGAGFAYSNNAENIYSFNINRVEPLRIPWLSYITGPFRYEFLIGALHGHTLVPNPAYPGQGQPNAFNPNSPWVHVEKVSFKPTENLEFGFERTVIWGGEGHGPITIHSFLKSFFSVASPPANEKLGRDDPGARFGAFDFSYRLPWVRNWFTLYADGEVHDDISPIDAPRRASWRPGLYLSHVPGLAALDMRAEAVYTDPPVSTSNTGRFMYWEALQRQGYTNNGQIFGDWVGREGKGGQAWLTYHLSGNEWLQVRYRNQKTAKDFIRYGNMEYGTTLNNFTFEAVKRLTPNFEINGSFTFEHYKAPMYLTNQQTVTTTNIQLTWYPDRKISF
jgi:Capsule assembly protein Wzi